MLVDRWGVVKGSVYLWVSVGNLCNSQPFHGLGGGGWSQEGEYSPGLCRRYPANPIWESSLLLQ